MTKDSEPYEQNVREQYERLGRFVDSFEAMVAGVRNNCIRFFDDGKGKARLAQIVFHHQTMTAKPLFDIFRAIIVQTITDATFAKEHNVLPADIEAFRGILSVASKEYSSLTNLRNSLLHGTWFVGYVGEDPTSPDFDVFKYTINKEGIARVELPRTASELAHLSLRCEECDDLISLISECVPPTSPHYRITDHFHQVDGTWKRAWTWRSPRGSLAE